METFTRPTLPTSPAPPVLPGGGPYPVSQAIFQEQVKEFIKQMNKLEENIKVFGVYCGDNHLMPSK